MSRNRITEITVAVSVSHHGHFSAVGALNAAGIVITEPVTYEFDRKRLYEDNEGFEVEVVEYDGVEHVKYERTCGPDQEPLSAVISVHYK